MDIDLLRAFCQLAKSENYRVASNQLFITQSALTKKIKRLEENLGINLFERGRHGARLTQAGLTLLPDALLTISKFEEFQRLSSCVSEGSVGQLNIGFGISTYQHAPECIAQFKSLYPNVHVTLNDLPASVQEQKLLSGELHIGFTRLQNLRSPLKGIKLLTDNLSIAVHQDEVIELNNVWQSVSHMGYLQLNPTRGARLHHQISSFLAHKNLILKATQEADDILTLLALVSAKLGYTIIPSSSIAICQPNIRLIPLKGKMTHWDVGLIWNPTLNNNVIQKFVEHVEKN